MQIAVILAAAGQSKRFGPRNKLEQDLGGRPVLLRSLELFANRPEVTTILVAADPDRLDEVKMRFGDALAIRGAKLVAGGRIARWETVRNALQEVPAEATHIVIHDGARPCVTDDLLGRLFEAAKLFDAVVPGLPVTSTLKRVGVEVEAAAEDDAIASSILGDAGVEKTQAHQVTETVPREGLMTVQTPQIFEANLLRRAYAQDNLDSTDDAALVERLGEPVRLIDGEPMNVKITTTADLKLAGMILGVKPEKKRPTHLRF